jgi:hypothetical protein
MKLYEIGEEYRAFLAAVEAGDIPEDAIADTLEALDGAFEDKADNTACVIKELLSEAEAIKAEVDALNERAKTKKAHADKLHRYLFAQMKAMGKTGFESARNKLTIKKTPAACVIEDEAELVKYLQDKDMDNLVKYEATPKKSEIKKLVQDGTEIPGVSLQTEERLYIK